MNCDQFQQRMDWILDQRQNVDRDAALMDHAESCETCCQRLQIWSTIDDLVLPASVSVSDFGSKLPLMQSALAAAAAILLFVTLIPSLTTDPPKTNTIASVVEMSPSSTTGPDARPIINPMSPGTAQSTPQLTWQSPQWWTTMSDERWVSHTIPAVTSVRLGVAPIGRSMRQALSILMIQTHSKQAHPSGVTPAVAPNQFKQQSSHEVLSQHFAGLS